MNYNPRKLEGHTYVWMAFIYALIPLLFPLGIKWFGHLNIIIRSIIYMIAIFIIEFIGGFLLDSLTGFCPWDYTGSTWSVMGYIRLDYFPAWMVFGIIVETFYKFVSEKIKD
ncbi:MAG: putative ABC transporter permease [Saprospiraceae bacterium]